MNERAFEVKKNCFAYSTRKKMMDGISQTVDYCKVCKEVYCQKGSCPFFKPKDVWERELIDLHGTCNLNQIYKDYEIQKTGGSKR